MEYMIIRTRSLSPKSVDNLVEELGKKVNMAIQDGWRPQGGIAMHFDGNNMRDMYQPMVKD